MPNFNLIWERPDPSPEPTEPLDHLMNNPSIFACEMGEVQRSDAFANDRGDAGRLTCPGC